VDDLFNVDEDTIYSSLNELERLEQVIQSDQCFIRYVCCFVVFLTLESH